MCKYRVSGCFDTPYSQCLNDDLVPIGLDPFTGMEFEDVDVSGTGLFDGCEGHNMDAVAPSLKGCF